MRVFRVVERPGAKKGSKSKMMKQILLMVGLVTASTAALAIPTLQVGVPDGMGGYVAYTSTLTNPTEDDTAVTSGNTLLVAGAYGPNDILIGGRTVSGWPAFGMPSWGDDIRAVLMATVPGELAGGSITVDGASAFYETSGYQVGFTMPNPPSDHAPVKETGGMNNSYLFFNVGDFSSTGTVPNFRDPTDTAAGQVKELSLLVTGFEWVHFDLLALVSREVGQGRTSVNAEGNPGSHDVTWKTDGGGPPSEIPEPGTLLLLGGAFAALGLRRRFRN